MAKIEVIVVDKNLRKFEGVARKFSRRLGAVLAKQTSFFHKKDLIEVYLIGGRKMRLLNKRFMKKDKDTNVLSFVSPKNFPDIALGEVYLNPLFIKKNNQDLAQMMAHGVLHILGYDHIKKSDRIKMEKKEKQLLSKLVASR